MLTPAATLSQQVATQSAETQVPFTRSMLNMLGDRLHNVPKNCQFRSPFESKGCQPKIPRTKALVLLKKIKKYSTLHRYDRLSPPTFIVCSKMLYNIHMVPLLVSLTLIIKPLLCSQVLINLTEEERQTLKQKIILQKNCEIYIHTVFSGL
jgi:hypothetical protein